MRAFIPFFFAFLFLAPFMHTKAKEAALDRIEITSDGIGPIRLGKALPVDLLPKDLVSRYQAGLHSDGEPYDALHLEHPNIIIFFDRGPFQFEFGRRPEAALGILKDKGPEVFGRRLSGYLKRGVRVKAIMVMDPTIRTGQGVGPSSTLEELKKAYPDVKLWPVPPTLGGDECVAQSPSLQNVRFIFSSCEAAKVHGGAVVRVDLWLE